MSRRPALIGPFAAMFLTGLAMSLTGCQKPRERPEDIVGNPPPKPPNCPETEDLGSVTLANGEVAEVRIVQFGDTRLYFPTDWARGEFADTKSYASTKKLLIGNFDPDIHSVECPGVVHHFIDERPDDTRSIPIVGMRIQGREPPSNLTSPDIDYLGITKHTDPPGSRLKVAQWGAFFNYLSNPMPDILVFIQVPKEKYLMGGEVENRSVKNVVEWLATPPVDRNNDQKFTVFMEDAPVESVVDQLVSSSDDRNNDRKPTGSMEEVND